MTSGDKPDPRRPAGKSPADRVHGSSNAAASHAKSAQTRALAQEVLHRWGYVVKSTSWRPSVVPVDPAAQRECLCGVPADFVVETNWFSGRHSQDPVCGSHVDEVVRVIRKEQARRNGG